MQIDDNLQSGLASPLDGLVKIWSGTGDVFPLDLEEGPVPDGNTDNVEAGFLDLLEVFELDEAVPVGFKDFLAFGLADLLAEGPFVHDGGVVGGVFPEDRRRNESKGLRM